MELVSCTKVGPIGMHIGLSAIFVSASEEETIGRCKELVLSQS